MQSQHRSIDPILQGAKILLSESGIRAASMIDIAARSAVARATVYNHFRDKDELLNELLLSELLRLKDLALKSASKQEALFQLSREISEDRAVAKIRKSDPEYFVKLLVESEDPNWNVVHESLKEIFGGDSNLVLHWLLSQLAAPLTERESLDQSTTLAKVFL